LTIVYTSWRATYLRSPFSHQAAIILKVAQQPSINELAAFGLALRALRQKAQLSQEQLAGLCGLHRTYIGSVERGERNVGLLNIYVLARGLNTTAIELLRAAERFRQLPNREEGSAS
jgi:DNA-binding XRE family transcriptional regulator